MNQGDQFQTSFCFFKKAFCNVKAIVSTLVFIYFGRPGLGHTIKTNFLTFQIADPEICSI